MSKILLNIAEAKTRTAKKWVNKKYSWETFSDVLSNCTRTPETVAEYHKMTKEQQKDRKDANGGFVGGYLKDGIRSSRSIVNRQILTLDMDHLSISVDEVWNLLCGKFGCSFLIYSSHSHTPEKPRLRLVMPLDRPVTPEEYQAIGRCLADTVGMDMFDATTFQPERLMYWPSAPHDGEFVYKLKGGDPLAADMILDYYIDPTDISEWPRHPREKDIMRKRAEVQGSPRDKEGQIGAFCRIYDVYRVIEEILEGVYLPTGSDDRFTYAEGTSASGAIVYQDGDFLYSHHSTDPAQGQLVNAFDLVRIHKFGKLDGDSPEGKKHTSLPSFKAMLDFVGGLKDVKREMVLSEFEEEEREELEEVDTDWLDNLSINSKGEIETTIPNFETIIENDPHLKGRFYYDEFEDRSFGLMPLPWDDREGIHDLKDIDDSNLESYITKKYKLHHAMNIKKAFDNVCYKYKKHPLKEYLETLEWDGKPRMESVFIDHLGAEDSEYVRTVTRKSLLAAVTRIYKPGAKFDNALVLVGPEGIRKSTLLSMLGRNWFSDTFVGVSGTDSMQQLQGTWIMEMPELAALKKAEVTAVKSFLSKQFDKYRPSYGRRNLIRKRQVVFFGTTNENNFLRGEDGNRRFWPVEVHQHKDFDKIDIDQIWAEAKQYYLNGETLELPAHIVEQAKEIQKKHAATDDTKGIIANYLEAPIPDNWDEMTRIERRDYYVGDDHGLNKRGTKIRNKICAAEIWVEVYMGTPKDMTTHNTKRIHEIMSNMPGWEKCPYPLNFSVYGKQRAYIRKGTKPTEYVKEERGQKTIEDLI